MLLRIISFGGDSEFLKKAMQVRKAVFVDELGVPAALDFDSKDVDAIHFLLEVDSEPAATARYLELDKEIKIERFSVKKEFRSMGIGHLFLRYIVRDALPSKKVIVANVPEPLVSFFEMDGFVITDTKTNELGIERIKMVYAKSEKGENFIQKLFKKK